MSCSYFSQSSNHPRPRFQNTRTQSDESYRVIRLFCASCFSGLHRFHVLHRKYSILNLAFVYQVRFHDSTTAYQILTSHLQPWQITFAEDCSWALILSGTAASPAANTMQPALFLGAPSHGRHTSVYHTKQHSLNVRAAFVDSHPHPLD
jgi:hypothetical protein